jgi:hypothetical protein
LSSTLTGGLIGRGVTAKGGTLKAKSSGFIPNFASSEILGALAGGYDPGYVRKMNIPGEGSVTYNSAEKVKKFPGMSQPAIMPPQGSKAGKNYQSQFDSVYGFNPYASSGFIPNFAPGPADAIRSIGIKSLEDAKKYLIPGTKSYKINGQTVSQAQLQGVLTRTPRGQAARGAKPLDVSSIASVLLPFIGSSRRLTGPFSPKGKSSEFAITNVPVHGMKKAALDGDTADDKIKLGTTITNSILDSTNDFVNTLKPLGKTVNRGTLASEFSRSGEKGAYGAVRGAVGSAFEIGIKTALKYSGQDQLKGFGDFDVRAGRNLGHLQKLFGFTTSLADFKGGLSEGNLQSFANKVYKEVGMSQFGRFSTAKGKKASEGFIPNFSALNDAIGREAEAGTSMSRIRVGKDSRLTSGSNPLGLGVYNTKDEPMGLGQGVARYGSSKAKSAGASKGFIPNFNLVAGAAGAGATAFILRQVLSAALFIAIDRLGSKIQEKIADQKTSAGVGAAIQGAGYAGTTLLAGGGKKAAGGAFLTGVLLSLVNSLGSLDQTTKDAISASENNKDKLDAFSSAAQSYNQVLEKLRDETLTSAEKQKILAESNESLATILSNTPTELQKNLKDAVSSGNFDNITQTLGQIQIALQTSATNTDNLANIIQIAADKSLKANELQKFTDTILNFRTTKGTSVRGEIISNPKLRDEFTQELGSVIANLQARNAKYGQGTPVIGRSSVGGMSEDQVFAPTITGAQGSILSPDEANLIKETVAILGPIRNLLLKAGVGKETTTQILTELEKFSFDDLDQGSTELSKRLKELGIDTKSLSKEIEKIVRYTKDAFLRRAEQAGDVSANSEALKRFQENLSPQALEEYGKAVLDANKDLNANRIVTAKVLDLQEGLRKSILNETERRKVEARYITQVSEALAQAGGDLDKFSIGLEGAQERLTSRSQRDRGLVFADQYRSDQQASREKQILGGRKSMGDIGLAFFDQFDNRAEDSYREAQLGAADTARTIKSEFNNAFLSFANGTATASDAFTKMALNISDKIQQLALEFSTNLIFGKLFGTTSNMFGGGGGGGIGDFFGSLFKSKGGIIKGYSSGGNVTGGSGNKDDVPAMLSGGEYVVRKSAVDKYGSGLLHMINGGRINGFASGGESSYNGTNVYRYNDPLYPTAGENVIDPRLSLQAIIDPNNPQNKIRQEREQSLYDYLNYAEGVRLENERALQENIDLNKKIQDEYNQQKNAKSNGAWYQALFGLAGAGLSFVGSNGGFGGSSASKYGASATLGGGAAARQTYANSAPFRYSTPTPRANGGYIRGFANGGSSGKDDIPAMLMGGEFVVRKEAVNMYGKKFFDDLNSGRAKKFADGGSVDNSSAGMSSTNYTPTNNVSVVVNLNQENVANENTKEDSNDEKRAEAQRTKELAEKVKTQVMRVITEQQRPGGLLSSAVYRKIQK